MPGVQPLPGDRVVDRLARRDRKRRYPAAPGISGAHLGLRLYPGPHARWLQVPLLTIIDEASRECLALIVARQLKHEDVLAALAVLFMARGPPANTGPTTAANLSRRRFRSDWRRSA